MEEGKQGDELSVPNKTRKQNYDGLSRRTKLRYIHNRTLAIKRELECSSGISGTDSIVTPLNFETSNSVSSSKLIRLSEDEDVDNLNSEIDNTETLPSHENVLSNKLLLWSVNHNITHSALTDLLHIIHSVDPTLPLDSRTLLQTSKGIDLVPCAGGSFVYFGLEQGVRDKIKLGLINPTYPLLRKLEHEFKDRTYLSVTLNIDGLPLQSSSTNCFWPILGIVDQAVNKTPFIISLYYGESKPCDSNSFFRPFVDECLNLEQNGIIINKKHYFFRISCIIADAPARSFLKCIVSHNSVHGCEKCEQEGTYAGRTIWSYKKNLRLRNDMSFKNQSYEDHQRSKSVLSDLNIGLITQVPLDYMHLVCLGVMKRLVRIWFDKGPKKCRIRSSDTEVVSVRLLSIRKYIPREFSRKPRPIKMFKFWKATEFRCFLLYLGPVVLRDLLPNSLYDHFLLFHCAIFILISKKSECLEWVKYANKLLHLFIEHTAKVYCKELLIYSFHNLLHLANDVESFGSLDQFSAFPFENYMSKLKRLIHAPGNPLKQVAKRLLERRFLNEPTPKLQSKCKTIGGSVTSFYVKHMNCIAGTLVRDSCFLTNINDIIVIKSINFTSSQGVFELICDRFLFKSDFYSLPLRSSDLGVYVVKRSETSSVTITSHDLNTKCILLPNFQESTSFICFPFCNMQLCC